VVLVSHDRYLLRAIIERDYDDQDSDNEDLEDERVQPATESAVYALQKRRLVLLEHGVSQFEQQLVRAVIRQHETYCISRCLVNNGPLLVE
jgi:hypothetical protein